MKTAYLTFDIETDWGGRTAPENGTLTGILEGMPWLLEILKQYSVRSTFFISGEIIEHCKDILKEIEPLGHELAVHGFCHRHSYNILSKEQLRNDVLKAKEALMRLTEKEPLGFRTPQFRFREDLFALLDELNFKYDSSICRSPISRTKKIRVQNISPVEEYEVGVWHRLKLPMGLVWIHNMGHRSFIESAAVQDGIIIYAHPFDLVKKNYDRRFSMKVNFWYYIMADTKIKDTLCRLIEGLAGKGFKFEPLRQKIINHANIF
ncbi:polysaccharide deacetylase family protein [Candidatus Magnetominusculus xianensis]|uniref:Polysaccharide deacetylase n=1 Tax=Candidatus Magnetominusculus xianensis TaxID=1748249 RepID=A0ABR5SKF2_9BACT|nr:polysaccharide deacetylase family protein [Candidatus Magnetominusculus xianensis]KWT90140.1 polysaccharide deacetylase [Candidatus Magnetominusculus xianensis]MBF0403634.1 polysaccharide deacetylase family protein [Nitrospirota bacterium]